MKRMAMYGAVIGAAAGFGFGSVALATDAEIYGRVVSGIILDKASGSDATWDIGSTDAGDVGGGDHLYSRIGLRVTHELDSGMTAGAHVEKRIDSWRTRHQNVYLEGGMGRLTLGQQSLPFYGAVSWDGANFRGGAFDPSSRGNGVKFTSNTRGPFDFGFMLRDGDGGANDDAVNEYQITGAFDAGGLATFSLGYVGSDDDGPYSAGGTIGGNAGGLSWKGGYHTTEDTKNVYGLHLGYGVGGGNLYAQYEDCNVDNAAQGVRDAAVVAGLGGLDNRPSLVDSSGNPLMLNEAGDGYVDEDGVPGIPVTSTGTKGAGEQPLWQRQDEDGEWVTSTRGNATRSTAAGERPVRRTGESNEDFQHRLEDWRIAHDDAVVDWLPSHNRAVSAWDLARTRGVFAGSGVCGAGAMGWQDDRSMILGYSYPLGKSTRVIAEHRNMSQGSDTTIVAVRVDF